MERLLNLGLKRNFFKVNLFKEATEPSRKILLYFCQAWIVTYTNKRLLCCHVSPELDSLKARPHLYMNAKKACRTKANAKTLLVQCLPHKRLSKHSAGHSLAAWMNVHSHQFDCERIFLWSTDSRRIAFACLPNTRHISEWMWMLFAYMSTLCVSHAFSCLRTDVDAA